MKKKLKRIPKSKTVFRRIKDVSKKGFSPSSLTTYIRNPIDFYTQRILNLSESDLVEESLAAKTLGSILHNSLEELYKPHINKYLSEDVVQNMIDRSESIVTKHFKVEYKLGNIHQGKNLLAYEVTKQYILNFLHTEQQLIKGGNSLKIIDIERENTVRFPIHEIDFQVNLTGKVDRIDELNGQLRIIDYKTGKVFQSQVELAEWDQMLSDYKKYSKSFQVLLYTLILSLNKQITLPVEGGIISFKNLKAGFLKFGVKPSTRSREKNTEITQDTLLNFQNQLTKLILEICNSKIDFIEKEL